MPKPARPSAPTASKVVNLHDARLSRRVDAYRGRLDRVLKANKRAITRLFGTGLLFTRHGTRAGRDLLLAHEHLLRVVSLVDRLQNEGDVPAPRKSSEVDAIFEELEQLLDRTSELTEHTATLLDELGRD
ncbi:MAG: hypothetical protein U0228_36110 [Myxococcaceae bacterium]